MTAINMDYEAARFNMVEQQIRPWNVLDQTVLDLLFSVKREEFAPSVYRELAFADTEIPLGYGATMFPPKTEARMLQALAVQPNDKVLEIGTGSGYMAALLAAQAEHVVSIEIVPELAQMARHNLAKTNVGNVSVEIGDGIRGWSSRGPYDVIVLSGSMLAIPPELLAQLKIGGRMAAIVGQAPAMEAQLITRTTTDAYNTVNLFETVVAPFVNVPQSTRFKF